EDELAALGDVDDWQAEWKWDGIRAQLVRRRGRTFLWTRGEELVTERFPEIAEAARLLPDGTVLDGEILPWRDEAPLPFAQLQRRIGRTKLGPKILSEVPVALVAYDLLEHAGADVRSKPFWWRRDTLVALLSEVRGTDRFRVSPVVTAATWEGLQREQARARGVRRGADAEAARRALRRGAPARPVVEMEGRSVHRRCRPHLCAAGEWPARVPAHRLHVRGVERPGRAGTLRKGVLGSHGR